MDEQQELIRLLKAVGADVWRVCVVGRGVFSTDEKFVRVFASKHKMEVVPIEGQITGWYAKPKDDSTR
jgi:hypothetical protein